jgi:hypothetical protein
MQIEATFPNQFYEVSITQLYLCIHFLYINNELAEKEVRKTIPLTIASRNTYTKT